MELIKSLKLKKPLITGLVLIGIAMIFRLLDIFVFKLDDLWGEIIVSKIIGFIIVLIFVKLVGESLKDIGFNFINKKSIIIIGGIFTAFLLVACYLFEIMMFRNKGPVLKLAAIDPKAGVSGGLWFAFFLLMGNVVNCFMEEGLFRGILIPMLSKKYSIRMTILLQGLLFGLWHIPWAFKWYQSGIVEGTSGFIMAFVMNCIPMIFMGIVWGVMYYYTDSIWAPWISHFITNSVLNLLHTNYGGELDSGMFIRMALFQTVMFALIPVIIKTSKALNENQILRK